MKPVYNSDGRVAAVIHRGCLYNPDGDWIGFLRGAEVFDTMGVYLGYLSGDRRLLRARRAPRRELSPLPAPARLASIPEWFPLAPMFQQLTHSLIEVFEEEPGRFRHAAETRPDMD